MNCVDHKKCLSKSRPNVQWFFGLFSPQRRKNVEPGFGRNDHDENSGDGAGAQHGIR
jgi:hypothetical protein